MAENKSKLEMVLVSLAALVGLVVLPCLNAFTPPESFFHISN